MQSIFSLSLLLIFLVLSLTIGFKVMRLLKIIGLRLSEYYLLAFALGTGIISISMFVIGFAGYLTQQFVLTLFLISFVIFCVSEYPRLISMINQVGKLFSLLRGYYLIAIVSIFVIYAVWNLFVCLTPVIDGDSLAAYLYVPKLYIEQGIIYPVQWLIWDDFPLGIHMLNTFGLIIDSDILAQLISGWLMGILNLIAVYTLARNFSRKCISLLASLAFYTIPTISWLVFSTKIDMGFAFYELSFWALFFSWIRTKQLPHLFVSAIVLGFAIGAKYHGLVALCFSLVILCIVLLLRKNGILRTIQIATAFCLVSVIIGSPSYVKNAIFVGDPVHPYLTNPEFGSGEQRNPYTNALEYARFQWNIFSGLEFNGTKYNFPDKPIGIIPILLLPFSLIGMKNLGKTGKAIALTMLGYYLIVSVIMFASVWPYPRHMLPAIGLLFAFSANGINTLFSSIIWRVFKIIIITVMVAIIIPNNGLPIGPRSIYRFKEQYKYIVDDIDKNEYLKRVLFDVPYSSHINSKMINYIATLPIDTRILTLDYGNGYYVPRHLVKRKYTLSKLTVEQWIDKLNEDEITHVYFSKTNLASIEKQYRKQSNLLFLGEENGFLMKEYTSDDQYLLRISILHTE